MPEGIANRYNALLGYRILPRLHYLEVSSSIIFLKKIVKRVLLKMDQGNIFYKHLIWKKIKVNGL